MLEHRKNYESQLEAQLAQWKADIDVIKAKASRAEVAAKVHYDQSIDHLHRLHEDAGHRLSSLKEASEEAWESLKLGTEKAWTRFSSEFHRSSEKP